MQRRKAEKLRSSNQKKLFQVFLKNYFVIKFNTKEIKIINNSKKVREKDTKKKGREIKIE